MRKVLLRAFLALILASALVTVVGWLLPRQHIAASHALFHQSPEAVWEVISAVETSSRWRSQVDRIERRDDRNGMPVWVESGPDGRMMMEMVEASPPRRMVTRIADADLPFGGTWTFELAAEDGGCRLRLTERGEIYNPIFRFMARFLFGHHSTIETYLQDLGAYFGEQIHAERDE